MNKFIGAIASSVAKSPIKFSVPNPNNFANIFQSLVYENISGDDTAIFLNEKEGSPFISGEPNITMSRGAAIYKSLMTSGITATAMASGYNSYRGYTNFGVFGYLPYSNNTFSAHLCQSDPWDMSQSTFYTKTVVSGDVAFYFYKVKSAIYFSHPGNFFNPKYDAYQLILESNRQKTIEDRNDGSVYVYGGTGVLPAYSWFKAYRGQTETIAIAKNVNVCLQWPYGISENYTKTLPFSANWSDVKKLNGIYYIVAEDTDQYAYSTNGGETWLAGSFGINQKWSSISYGNGIFIAIAKNSNIICVSTDGLSWTKKSIVKERNWSAIEFVNNMFVIASGNNISHPNTYARIEPSKIQELITIA